MTSETYKGLKRVTVICLPCSWIFTFPSTIFGKRRKGNRPIKLRKESDVILLHVFRRKPEIAQATTMATSTKTYVKSLSALLQTLSRLFHLVQLSKEEFRKRKRKSLYCIFALHKRAISCRTRTVSAKICNFWGRSEGFLICYVLRKNE